MKLESFDTEPAPERLRARDRRSEPTVLLYGDAGGEVARLREALRPLTEDVGRWVALHELPFVEPVGGCALIAVSGPRVVGVWVPEARAPRIFTWTHDPLTWLQTVDLLEPFERIEPSRESFQFLSEGQGPRVVYSTHRGW
jgi:hypothetical protein